MEEKTKLERLLAEYHLKKMETREDRWYGTCYGKEIEKDEGVNYQ